MPPQPKKGNTEGGTTPWEWVGLIAVWPVVWGLAFLLDKLLG